jgi:hypothetical protein
LKRGTFGKWGWGSPPAIHRPAIGNGGLEGIVESILAWEEKRHVYNFMQKLSVISFQGIEETEQHSYWCTTRQSRIDSTRDTTISRVKSYETD